MSKDVDIEVLKAGKFDVVYIHSVPQRLESKVVFNREDISQKLVFTLMDITHEHGFGCSPPYFKEDDVEMTFLIGTILPTKKSINKYSKKMHECLLEVEEFANYFNEQLDFSSLDLSMFSDIDYDSFFPEQIAALKDQHYNGSWELLYEDLIDKRKNTQAEIIKRCVEFEEVNGKDMGLVGHKLFNIMQMLDESTNTGDN